MVDTSRDRPAGEFRPDTEEVPWLTLADLIDEGSGAEVQAFIDRLSPAETALAVSRLDPARQESLLKILSAEDVAEMLVDLPDEQAADLLGDLSAKDAAEIVDFMESNEQADILANVGSREVEAILREMPHEEAARTREILAYARDTAGALMNTEFVVFEEQRTVDAVLSHLREKADTYSDYEVQYAYVTRSGLLTGVLRLRDLLLSRGQTQIRDIMIKEPVRVLTGATLSDLVQLFESHPGFIGVPVVEPLGQLVGVVRRKTVQEAQGEQAKSLFLKFSGIVGGEEYRSLPVHQRALRRLAFLAPNIVLNMVAASVIAMYQETILAVVALAVFLPIISDMSGCAGNQAVAVSIRELSLGLIRPGEYLRVFSKEAWVGLANGAVLGALLGLVAVLWSGDAILGMVVGSALALNTLLSVLIGGSMPLLLKRLGADPALASMPLLTTVTDMCGFFFVLSFAKAALT